MNSRSTLFVWFGVGGGALAWIAQHVANVELGFARCNPSGGRFPVAFHSIAAAITLAAVLVAVLAEAAALAAFRATSGQGSEPPAGRIHFLAVVGLTVNPLVLAIILMSGVGTLLLPLCHQS